MSSVVEPLSLEPLQPLPGPPSGEENKVALGRLLFKEPKLSASGALSCASCHELELAGTDNKIHETKPGVWINTPTVINAALNYRLFWDGRARSVADQIDGPIHNANEMATSWPDVVSRLQHSAEYRTRFEEIYRDGITGENVKDAIGAFERSLLAVDSPFDRYLRGDASAISDEARRGYELFKSFGCASCHQGANVGGNLLQPLGVMRPSGTPGEWRVPSLRLAVLTPPYLHDGSSPDLDAVIALMADKQLGIEITAKERGLLVAFLKTLPGTWKP